MATKLPELFSRNRAWAADITRSFPVTGRFSGEQRAVAFDLIPAAVTR